MHGYLSLALIGLLACGRQVIAVLVVPTGCCVDCNNGTNICLPGLADCALTTWTYYDGDTVCAETCPPDNPEPCGCMDQDATNYDPDARGEILDSCFFCPENAGDPVCGMDEQTYYSTCHAEGYNIEVACNTPCPCDGNVHGDPHFVGFNGGKYDFPGEIGTVYNIISDEHFQLNSRFIEPIHNETQCKGNETEVSTALFFQCEHECFSASQCAAYSWSKTTNECKKFDSFGATKQADGSLCGVFDVPKMHSFMGDLGMLIGAHKLTIHVGIDGPSVVFLDGDVVPNDIVLEDVPATFEFEHLKTKRRSPDVARYMLTLPNYKIEIAQKKFHFNVEVEYIPEEGSHLPHGALGQSSRWTKACFSESKNGKSCIEGGYPDYEIQSGDLLGTDFRWNQYTG